MGELHPHVRLQRPCLTHVGRTLEHAGLGQRGQAPRILVSSRLCAVLRRLRLARRARVCPHRLLRSPISLVTAPFPQRAMPRRRPRSRRAPRSAPPYRLRPCPRGDLRRLRGRAAGELFRRQHAHATAPGHVGGRHPYGGLRLRNVYARLRRRPLLLLSPHRARHYMRGGAVPCASQRPVVSWQRWGHLWRLLPRHVHHVRRQRFGLPRPHAGGPHLRQRHCSDARRHAHRFVAGIHADEQRVLESRHACEPHRLLHRRRGPHRQHGLHRRQPSHLVPACTGPNPLAHTRLRRALRAACP